MTATPLWFGPTGRPLFGWLHVPADGRARAAVVLCQPLGTEGVSAKRGFRKLAERLASLGLLALHFDYDGTGDSAGSSADPGRVAAWRASVGAAVEAVRAAGIRQVVVVGMRVGATLAAAEAAGQDLAGLVLWDPCATGRSYVRSQQALAAFSLEASSRSDGSVEAPGVLYSAETVEELRALAVPQADEPLAGRVLVLTRPDQPDPALARRLAGQPVEWGSAEDQPQVVEVKPDAAIVPERTIDLVSSWISDMAGDDASGIELDQVETSAVLADSVGTPLVERAERMGPSGLFGIVTEPARVQGPWKLVFLNPGVIDHVGPARLWVDLARRWAAAGLCCARVDLSGLGASPTHAGQLEHLTYPPEALDDIGEIIEAVSPGRPADVVMIGLCSGSYHAIEAGIGLGIKGVCLVNPVMASRPAETSVLGGRRVDQRRQASVATRPWARALPAHDVLGPLVQRLPGFVWWVIKRTAMHQTPVRALRMLVDRGVDTMIVCGDVENWEIRRGEGRALRQLKKMSNFHFEVLPGIDHELFGADSRRRTSRLLDEHVRSRYARDVPSDVGRAADSDVSGTPAAGTGLDGRGSNVDRAARSRDV